MFIVVPDSGKQKAKHLLDNLLPAAQDRRDLVGIISTTMTRGCIFN